MANTSFCIGFIGGGNMAAALIGGLRKQGFPPAQVQVVEPVAATRQGLEAQFGIVAQPGATEALSACELVVWAVKPQHLREAVEQASAYTSGALHLSVAAGIRSDSLAAWLGTQRVVRAMPNTPALIGLGMTGLYARPEVSTTERERVQQVLAPTGQWLWLQHEAQLDAVTALSGSGPAYVFFFLEAIIQAGVEMGLSAQQAHTLAVGTFAGASQLAASSSESPAVLRARVTSKGGTTHAALSSLEQDGVDKLFVKAMHAAQRRAEALGDEFGR